MAVKKAAKDRWRRRRRDEGDAKKARRSDRRRPPIRSRSTASAPVRSPSCASLARNNRKEWFEANRERYEAEIKAPLAWRSSRRWTCAWPRSPRRSWARSAVMFRIHRDVRFSKDKRPYKTHVACWFYHRDAGRAVGENAAHGGAGFYFHFAPGEVFTGGGVWMPPRPALLRIRDAIAEAPEVFEDHRDCARVQAPLRRPRSRSTCSCSMPRGYAPDHPAGDWLRYQSFTAGHALTEADLGSRQAGGPAGEGLPGDAAAGAVDQRGERVAGGGGAVANAAGRRRAAYSSFSDAGSCR